MKPEDKIALETILARYDKVNLTKAHLKKDQRFIDTDGVVRVVVATGKTSRGAYLLAYDDGTIQETSDDRTSVLVIRRKE